MFPPLPWLPLFVGSNGRGFTSKVWVVSCTKQFAVATLHGHSVCAVDSRAALKFYIAST